MKQKLKTPEVEEIRKENDRADKLTENLSLKTNNKGLYVIRDENTEEDLVIKKEDFKELTEMAK